MFKKQSKASGFTLERTVTLDKLGKTEADPDPVASSSPQTKSSPAKHSNSKQSPSSEDIKSPKEKKKLPEPIDKVTKEVKDEDYLFKQVYFAHSKTPRTKRPAHVKFKVGEVVKHKEDGFYGVIVGWDEHALVSESSVTCIFFSGS